MKTPPAFVVVRNRFALTGLLMLTALVAPAARLPDNFDVSAIDQFLSAQVQQPNRVGLSVAIIKDGKVVLAKGYGKRSLQDGRPVETNTLFAIGSVSKQFTCAAIFLLAEDGKLSVHDPVAKYYPNLTRAKDITLLDLMNHVAGYPDYYPLDFVDRRMMKPIAEDELLRQYAGGKLDFEPGAKWSYSNTGYILLGRIVEKISGENLGVFLSRRVFKPLAMNNTFYQLSTSDPRLATGYQRFALSEPEAMEAEANGWLGGAGGIYSTPRDLAKWDLALIGGKVLKPESYALMTTARQLTDGRSAEYGCGLSVRTQGGRQVIAHNGAVSGFNTFNAVVPSTRSAVIMTCNLEGSFGSLPSQVFALLLKEQSNVPAVAGSAAVDVAKSVFTELQRGKVNRKQFGDEFNFYLTDAKIAGASKRLGKFGEPKRAEVINAHERGGMEVTTTRLVFASGELRALMYRMPDGTIEQFFLSQE
jgi:CubicO group peptidase (beta-lactamase class C family)